jgi:serine/threonine protein kinase
MGNKFEKKYEELETVQEGEFESVKRCRNRKKGELFSVKIIARKGRTEKEETLIKQRIGILQNFKHKNIATFVEYISSDINDYLVMESSVEGDLTKYIGYRNGNTLTDD